MKDSVVKEEKISTSEEIKDEKKNNKWKQNEKDLETIIDEIKIKAEKMIEKSKEKKLSSAELYDNGILELIIKNDYLHTLAKNYKDLLDVFEKFLIWDKDSMKWKKEDE